MKVRIDGHHVDVKDKGCRDRDCYALGFDKGTFVKGRGYTSYHTKERKVCMTRHLHGCPQRSICPSCRTVCVDPPGSPCKNAGLHFGCAEGSRTVAREVRE